MTLPQQDDFTLVRNTDNEVNYHHVVNKGSYVFGTFNDVLEIAKTYMEKGMIQSIESCVYDPNQHYAILFQ